MHALDEEKATFELTLPTVDRVNYAKSLRDMPPNEEFVLRSLTPTVYAKHYRIYYQLVLSGFHEKDDSFRYLGKTEVLLHPQP